MKHNIWEHIAARHAKYRALLEQRMPEAVARCDGLQTVLAVVRLGERMRRHGQRMQNHLERKP